MVSQGLRPGLRFFRAFGALIGEKSGLVPFAESAVYFQFFRIVTVQWRWDSQAILGILCSDRNCQFSSRRSIGCAERGWF